MLVASSSGPDTCSTRFAPAQCVQAAGRDEHARRGRVVGVSAPEEREALLQEPGGAEERVERFAAGAGGYKRGEQEGRQDFCEEFWREG